MLNDEEYEQVKRVLRAHYKKERHNVTVAE
jgi:hypothetical protein